MWCFGLGLGGGRAEGGGDCGHCGCVGDGWVQRVN